MDIQVIARSSDVDEMLRDWVHARVLQAFRHFVDRLTLVAVRLDDVNGPKGGIDKTAAIEVYGKDGRVAGMVAVGKDYHAAAGRVIKRAKRVVLRSPQIGGRRPRKRSRHLDAWVIASNIPDVLTPQRHYGADH